MLARERVKLADLHRGIKDMKHLPSAIFFVDGICEKIAIEEAKTLGIPVMGIVDSNTDPTSIDFPIPANDDSMKSIGLIVEYIADCILEAKGGSSDINNESSDTNDSDTKKSADLATSEMNDNASEISNKEKV